MNALPVTLIGEKWPCCREKDVCPLYRSSISTTKIFLLLSSYSAPWYSALRLKIPVPWPGARHSCKTQAAAIRSGTTKTTHHVALWPTLWPGGCSDTTGVLWVVGSPDLCCAPRAKLRMGLSAFLPRAALEACEDKRTAVDRTMWRKNRWQGQTQTRLLILCFSLVERVTS